MVQLIDLFLSHIAYFHFPHVRAKLHSDSFNSAVHFTIHRLSLSGLSDHLKALFRPSESESEKRSKNRRQRSQEYLSNIKENFCFRFRLVRIGLKGPFTPSESEGESENFL